jgi:hypothetical protein
VCADVSYIADKICDAHCSDKRKTLYYYYINLALWITVTNSCHREREKERETATLHILIFLVVMPWNLIDKYQHFIRNYYLKRSGEIGANRFFEILV